MDISPLGKTIAIILVVVLVFLLPLPYIAKLNSETMDDLINKKLTELTGEARQQRTITKESYEAMLRALDRTGELYDIDIEVSHPVSGSELTKVELGDKMPDKSIQKASVSNEKYSGRDIIGHEMDIKSLSTHTHTDACYAGHRHMNPYPTSSITPPYVYILKEPHNTGKGGYLYNIKCSDCGTTIYAFARNDSDRSGWTITYNSSGVATRTDFTTTTSSENMFTFISELANTYIPVGSIVSSDFIYPDTQFYAYNSSGIAFSTPFGCYNAMRHPDNNACFPIGYQGGTYRLSGNTSRIYDTHDVLSLYVVCDNCGYTCFSYSVSHGIRSNYVTEAGTSGSYSTYKSDGTSAFISHDSRFSSFASPFIKNWSTINTRWINLYSDLINAIRSMPGVTYHENINSSGKSFGSFSTGNLPLSSFSSLIFPVSFRAGDQAKVFNIPFSGCGRCSSSSTGYSCRTNQDNALICNQVVTSITATHPTQTMNKGENIFASATATYLDGHTGTVNCSVSGYNTNQSGTQTATLIYHGLVGDAKTNGTLTCTVSVTVKEAYQLTGITISPTSQEVPRYQNPSFVVTASYDNNSKKQVTDYHISGYNSSLPGPQTVTVTYTEMDITKTANATIIVKNLTVTCPICHGVYYLDDNDIDQGCPHCSSTIIGIMASPGSIMLHQGKPLEIAVEAEYANGKRSIITDWTSDFDSSQIGIQEVAITYQTFTTKITVEVRHPLKVCDICSLEYELNNDGTDPGCPDCSNTVTRIDATPKVLTITKHQILPITVTATYRDGHTVVINDWASNLIEDTAGIYEVMILYQDKIDLIKVTVLEDGQIECPYCGLKYIFNDSPKGCPSCSVTLTGIEASLRSSGNKVPYRSKLNLQIVKVYKDEHRELTYTDWTVSDYNPGQLGQQTITAHYEGFQDQFDIEVVDDLPEIICPKGHTYYWNADGSDPGCSFCNTAAVKAESLFYFDTTYTGIILNTIYTQGEYRLEKGDYLKITIKPRNASILSRLLNLFGRLVQKEFTFGGEVA